MRRILPILLSAALIFLIPTAAAQKNLNERISPLAWSDIYQGLTNVFQSQNSETAKERSQKLIEQIGQYLDYVSEISKAEFLLPGPIDALKLRDARLRKFDDDGGGVLILTKGGEAGHLQNSIVLSDGSVSISYATRCLIISAGGVDIAHGYGNIVISKYYLTVSHDHPYQKGSSGSIGFLPHSGRFPGREGNPDDSVAGSGQKREEETAYSSYLITDGIIDIAHANSSVVSAGYQLKMSHTHAVIGINVRDSNISWRNDMREIIDASLQVPKVNFADPVGGAVLWSPNPYYRQEMSSYRKQKQTPKLCFEGEEAFEFRLHQPIPDCCGPVTRKLSQWEPKNIIGKFIIFEKDGRYSLIERRQEPAPDKILQFKKGWLEKISEEIFGTDRICNF
jgi:hypothetical protein